MFVFAVRERKPPIRCSDSAAFSTVGTCARFHRCHFVVVTGHDRNSSAAAAAAASADVSFESAFSALTIACEIEVFVVS